MRARAKFAVSVVIFASACQRQTRDDKPASNAVASPAAAPAPSASAAAGTSLDAALHLPSLKAGQKVPLLVFLHGLGSSGEQLAEASDWPRFAAENGLAWAAPNGPFDRAGRRFWNAGPSCCNFDAVSVDHVAELAALIERFKRDPAIDAERVFVGGHSNGAFMAHRLACERPELLRGIIAVAGSGPLDRSACKTPRSLHVLQIQGDADPIVTYAGGHLFRNGSLPQHASARKTVEDWAAALGCAKPARLLPAVDFEAQLKGPETQVERYEGCQRGSVELWTVVGGGHYIGFRAPAPDAIGGFLRR